MGTRFDLVILFLIMYSKAIMKNSSCYDIEHNQNYSNSTANILKKKKKGIAATAFWLYVIQTKFLRTWDDNDNFLMSLSLFYALPYHPGCCLRYSRCSVNTEWINEFLKLKQKAPNTLNNVTLLFATSRFNNSYLTHLSPSLFFFVCAFKIMQVICAQIVHAQYFKICKAILVFCVLLI